MNQKKYIVVVQGIVSDSLYLNEENGVVAPAYFDSEKEARGCIEEFCLQSGDQEDVPLLVSIDCSRGTILDEAGKDWSMELKSQAPEAVVCHF